MDNLEGNGVTISSTGDSKEMLGKRSNTPSRDGSGRFNKSQKYSNTETFSQSKCISTSSTSYCTSSPDKSKPRGEVKYTRCWKTNPNHNYLNCPETQCSCGQPLSSKQPICYNITILLVLNLPREFPRRLPGS